MIPENLKESLEKERQEILQALKPKESEYSLFSTKDLEFFKSYIEFLKLLNLYLSHFPRHEKFALSQRIRNNAYSIYELLVEVKKKYYKKTSLTNLDITFETLKMQIYLAYNLGYFDYQKEQKGEFKGFLRYGVLGKHLKAIGSKIGALIKASKEQEKW